MLTLRQALQLPCFAKARVVAGEGGLDHIIRRAHVVDIPGIDYADRGRGLLLFTAGYGIKDNPAEQEILIPALAGQELAGMVFSTGWYFEAVPPVMRAAADAHDFPIIALPPEVQFIDIIERLYLEILNEQFALKERADDIHRRLTQLVLEGGDLAALTETLAAILNRSVLIESPTFEVLASAIHGPVDENRLRAIELGYTPREVSQRMIKRGVYAELQEKMRPVRMRTMPDIGMTMERVIAPIVVRREIYGYIWIVAGDHPLTDLDELAIEHAATVAALVMVKEEAVREAQQAARGDFLTQLLRPDSEIDPSVVARGNVAGYQFDHPHQVLFVMSQAEPLPLAARLDGWLRGLGQWSLVVAREKGIALIVESRTNAAGQALAQKVMAELGSRGWVGISQTTNDKSLRRVYDEAVEAADIGKRLNGATVTCFWELGLLDWLYRLPSEAVRANPYFAIVQALAEHDRKANSDLTRTLAAYLDHGGALAEAASALNVHRNTMLYRLGRIEEITKVDLRDVNQRLNLHVAVKAYQLSGS
ncbi:MAG: PucR family transcriptional regulator ligand-binding domain-containing protein, partial [Chloroflexota bacterium]